MPLSLSTYFGPWICTATKPILLLPYLLILIFFCQFTSSLTSVLDSPLLSIPTVTRLMSSPHRSNLTQKLPCSWCGLNPHVLMYSQKALKGRAPWRSSDGVMFPRSQWARFNPEWDRTSCHSLHHAFATTTAGLLKQSLWDLDNLFLLLASVSLPWE